MEKIKLQTALLCEAATIDQQNRAIIYGVFDQIQTKDLPVTHPVFTVFCIWQGETGEEHKESIKVVSPQGHILAQVLDAPFKIGKPQARVITNFNLMRFTEWGKYKIEISVDDKVVDELFLEVKKLAEG